MRRGLGEPGEPCSTVPRPFHKPRAESPQRAPPWGSARRPVEALGALEEQFDTAGPASATSMEAQLWPDLAPDAAAGRIDPASPAQPQRSAIYGGGPVGS